MSEIESKRQPNCKQTKDIYQVSCFYQRYVGSYYSRKIVHYHIKLLYFFQEDVLKG